MEIIVGKTSGFCLGVANTVKRAYEELEKSNERLFCLGEIVHNERVVDELSRKGMVFVQNVDDAPNGSRLIIRAHGEPKETYEIAKQKSLNLIDLTCGKIKVIRSKIEKANGEAFIVLIGKKQHPETIGTISFANNGMIVENEEDFEELKEKVKKSSLNKIKILSQTTFNEEKFNELSNKINEYFPNYEVDIDNTICNATHERQEETKEIAKQVDYMKIIGGKNSSNTKELYNVAKDFCKNVALIQDVKDLANESLNNYSRIGIIAGASTSESSINEVVEFLKSI